VRIVTRNMNSLNDIARDHRKGSKPSDHAPLVEDLA
jgi:hypothetical protein